MYLPIRVHSVWSMLDSTVALDKLAKKAKEYNLPAICLTDHMNLKGVVTFYQKVSNEGIRPIIGCELDIYNEDNTDINRVTVLAKNKTGYRNIIKILSGANNEQIIKKHGRPLVYWDNLVSNRMGLLVLVGDIYSEISRNIFENWDMAYRANNLDVCLSLLNKEDPINIIDKYLQTFGDNLYLFGDNGDLPIVQVIKERNKQIADKYLNGRFFSTNNIHYLNEEDKKIHKIILQSRVELDKAKVNKLEDYLDYRIFFTKQPNCHLSPEGDPKTLELLDLIEEYTIQESPILPKFTIGNNEVFDSDQRLYELCRQGFIKTGLANELRHNEYLKNLYGSRIREELKTFKEAGISGYFLIVHDLMHFAKNNGIPIDIRGSSTGCMASYLLGISSVDPLRPDPTLSYDPARELPFSRFYNKGRNSGGHVSLPDIDIDVPPNYREEIINYAKNKYGHDCVGRIITHSRFKGKGAIKEVFKLMDIPFSIANDITKLMVDEAKISDELAELQLDDPDYGIIQWNLDNVPELEQYYENYKKAFDIAIALEKIPRNASIHAAGIIIANQPLGNLFPVEYSEKTKELIVAIEGSDIEYIGGVKFDVLGVAMMEKIYKIEEMINNKMVEPIYGIERINSVGQ